MESLNQTLSLHLNAGPHPSIWVLVVATFLAEVAIGLIALTMLFDWLRGTDSTRAVLRRPLPTDSAADIASAASAATLYALLLEELGKMYSWACNPEIFAGLAMNTSRRSCMTT